MVPNKTERLLSTRLPRALLEVLAPADGGVRYPEARRCLKLSGLVRSPDDFQRALDRLMGAGLVEARVVPEGPATKRRRIVLLEASLLGKVLWRYQTLKDDALARAAHEFGFTPDQLNLETR